MDKSALLDKLPPFRNEGVVIARNQGVYDIVKEVLQAHDVFAPDYDAISGLFYFANPVDTFKALFQFLKDNVRYNVETEEKQTTKSPAALLATGTGDCKHYAGFIGGVIDSLRRKGAPIDWGYRFASYNFWDTAPQHVFIVARTAGTWYWIDPVLKSFDFRYKPAHYEDRRPKSYTMLQRVSGIEILPDAGLAISDEGELTPAQINAIKLLIHYAAIDIDGNVSDDAILAMQGKISADAYQDLLTARSLIVHARSIGNIFGTLLRGIKKVYMAPQRGAYLSLVALNVFGMARRLYEATYNPDLSYTPFKEKVKGLWQDTFGGDWTQLESAIKNGHNRPAIMGNPAAIAVPVWVAAATSIIAAMTPIITAALKSLNRPAISTGSTLPAGTSVTPVGGSYGATGGIMDWIKSNPLLVAGAGVVAWSFFSDKPKKHA